MVLLFRAGNSSAYTGPTGNNTWLLPGRVPTIVDAGVGNPDHIEAIGGALLTDSLSLVLITHSHVDHDSGVPALRSRWQSVRVRRYGGEDGLKHDERIAAGGTDLRVLHTPGHSPDHCCFLDEQTGDLFCGDLVLLGGTVVIPASRGGDLRQYLDSLKLVQRLSPMRLLPGHGPVIEDPQALISHYLRHRAQRDEQILAALSAGPLTPQQIAGKIYEGIAPTFGEAAADTVLAHLIKLRDEGRVRKQEEMWIHAG
jgi:glyoxylase-like metal-dependent hydrolase (beta-lactamase superfamily II)